jgi:hypothetical protein
MPDINNPILEGRLTPAPAGGGAVADPTRTHDVDRRAPHIGARSGGILDQVETIRRAALDDTIDRLSENATAAATAIVRLAKGARSEAVRLGAARSVLADLMAVETYATLVSRLAEVERRLDIRSTLFDGHDRGEPGRGPVLRGGRSDEAQPATTRGPLR